MEKEIYIDFLLKRYSELKVMTIKDMSDDEINEYLNVKSEILKEFPEIKDRVLLAWDIIKEQWKPYAKAYAKYKENVTNKK